MGKIDWKKDGRRVAVACALGAVTAAALAAALTMLLALAVSSGKVGEGTEKPMVIAAAFISTFIGAALARFRAGGAGLLTGAGTAFIVILARTLLMLISDKSTALDGADMSVILSVLCAGLASGAIFGRRRKKRR